MRNSHLGLRNTVFD